MFRLTAPSALALFQEIEPIMEQQQEHHRLSAIANYLKVSR